MATEQLVDDPDLSAGGPSGSPESDFDGTSAFVDVVSRLLSLLLQADAQSVGPALQTAMRCFGEFLGVDRSSLLEFRPDDSSLVLLHSWNRDAIPPLSRPQFDRLDWFKAQISAGRVVRLSRAHEELPPEAEDERQLVGLSGLKSNLCVPVRVEGKPICALAVGTFRRNRDWSDAEVKQVTAIAELIAATVHRSRQSKRLADHLDEIRRLNARLHSENLYLREEVESSRSSHRIVGESAAMQRVLNQAHLVADTDSTVLILGETGTGKELVARSIHDCSRRSRRALVRVNCAALPAGLVESELFGHEKGAFTGALSMRQGRFEVADGGTLFLDEVGDLPLESQAKLLRVLQEGEFERLGSTRTRKVDVRIIAATNRDLHADVQAGRFRQDLFYRLNVFIIAIPPLRERPEDIEPLVRLIVESRRGTLSRRTSVIPESVLARLQAYAWPGNVRELENVVERALILSTGDTLSLDGALARGGPPAAGDEPAEDLESIERRHVVSVLESCAWRIEGPGRAAERLGLPPSTLRSMIKRLGIVRRP